jgi:hypothetical protein
MYSIGSTGEEDMNHFDKTLKRNLVSSPPFLCPSIGDREGEEKIGTVSLDMP